MRALESSSQLRFQGPGSRGSLRSPCRLLLLPPPEALGERETRERPLCRFGASPPDPRRRRASLASRDACLALSMAALAAACASSASRRADLASFALVAYLTPARCPDAGRWAMACAGTPTVDASSAKLASGRGTP